MKKGVIFKGKVILLIFSILVPGFVMPFYPIIFNKNQINPVGLLHINDLLQKSRKDSLPKLESKQKNTPNDKTVTYSSNPRVVLDFHYDYNERSVSINIEIENNLVKPLTVFNLMIKINKEDTFSEYIAISDCYIEEDIHNLTLSTFDHYEEIFSYIKLLENKTIDKDKSYHINLKWYDFFGSFAEYISEEEGGGGDIVLNFLYSDREENNQPFPFVDRVFTQELNGDIFIFKVDFIISNLMDHPLTDFTLDYLKFKSEVNEIFYSLSAPPQFSSSHEDIDGKIIYSFWLDTSQPENVLAPGESVILKTSWIGDKIESNISFDAVRWNSPETKDYEEIIYLNSPYLPLMTPAEHSVSLDFDNDGLINELEFKEPSLDPYDPQSWINWERLSKDFYLEKSRITILGHSNNFVYYIAEAVIYITPQMEGKNLILEVLELGADDKIINLNVSNELKIELISSAPDSYVLAENLINQFLSINFTLKHQGTDTDISYRLEFYLDSSPLLDVSEFLFLDSDGDGLYDQFEIESLLEYGATYFDNFDTDMDWLGDSIDVSPTVTLDYEVENIPTIVFPIRNDDPNDQVLITIQIQPTAVDYTKHVLYGFDGNEIYIYPGIRVFGPEYGGDILPNNCVSVSGKTGTVDLTNGPNPIYKFPITWTAFLNYGSNNEAKIDGQIKLKFDLVWLVMERKPSGESNIIHIYERTQDLTIQGIKLTEYQSNKISVSTINDGNHYFKTVHYARSIAYIELSETLNTLSDIPVETVNLLSTPVYDMTRGEK
ncbi:MAG: hypothetical protein ACTSRG_22155 [Candidatus Helarchaeota archaeon]